MAEKARPDDARFERGDLIVHRFQVVRFLGRGGMGEVYEVRDDSTGDTVALKTVRARLAQNPKAVARFRRELRRARRVTHSNVCRLHEFFADTDHLGRPLAFFTMEMLSGTTLADLLRAQRLSADLALGYAEQIANGLEAAHAAGVVHGDIKPGNVIITACGDSTRAVITDFGLAMDSSGPRSSETIDGHLVGTPAYMAPEQKRGAPATTTSDIYSLGLVVSEMLLGRRPTDSMPACTSKQERVWMRAVEKCTAPEPAARFATASELITAIRADPQPPLSRRMLFAAAGGALAIAGGSFALWKWPPTRTISVAVLPIDGQGPEDEHIRYATTALLIERLRRFPGFQVPGISAVRRFEGKSLPVRSIAQKLSVEWLISCVLGSANGRVYIYARLVRADGAPGPWENRYEGGIERLDQMVASLASDAAGALRPDLTQERVSETPGTKNPEAYDLYLRGRYYWNRRQRDDLIEARRLLQRSVELDANFALGYCGLADTLSVLADYGQAPAGEVLPLAKQAALRALNLNSGLADCHVSFAFATCLNDFDWFTAQRSYLRAIELNPNHGLAHQWYSTLLARLLRADECLHHAKEAIRQDSLSISANRNLATMLYFLRRYPAAIAQAERVHELSPGYFGCREIIAESQARLGQRSAALDTLHAMIGDRRTPGFTLAYAVTTYAVLGLAEEAQSLIERLTDSAQHLNYQPVHIARAYSDLGRADDCLKWLEVAYEKRDTGLQILPMHQSFDPMRSHPRFRAFVARLRIVYPPNS